MRRRYLFTYDVTDDKRRNAIFKVLMGSGDHVQYSVFLCELNARELAEVKAHLADVLNHRRDQILILDMGPVDRDAGAVLQCMGKGYEPSVRVLVI